MFIVGKMIKFITIIVLRDIQKIVMQEKIRTTNLLVKLVKKDIIYIEDIVYR